MYNEYDLKNCMINGIIRFDLAKMIYGNDIDIYQIADDCIDYGFECEDPEEYEKERGLIDY